jgi:hypothetical protein
MIWSQPLALASQALALRRHRRAYAIQSAEQGVFNALMILRFMRDDAMTWQPRKDQIEFRARQKTRAAAAVSFLSHRGVKPFRSIRAGDSHDRSHDVIGCC